MSRRTVRAAPAGGSLPEPTTGDAGKVLTVNEAEDGFELAAPSQSGSSWKVLRWQGNVVRLGTSQAYVTEWTAYGDAALITPTQGQIDDDGGYSEPLPLPHLPTAGIWVLSLRKGSTTTSGGSASSDDTKIKQLGGYVYPYGSVDQLVSTYETLNVDRLQAVVDVAEDDSFVLVYGAHLRDAALDGVTARYTTVELTAMQLVSGPPDPQ